MRATWRDTLSADQVRAVRAIVDAATAADGVAPLSEDTRLLLRSGEPTGGHLLAVLDAGGAVGGYAHLDAGQAQAEVVVDPGHRRRGIGTVLVRSLVDAATAEAADHLGVWAHGDTPASGPLARRFGFTAQRVLWTMRRPLGPDSPDLPEPALPGGVSVRTFEVGRDETAWLRLNAAAFAHHPEQGRWTAADLALREREPWFDPSGFFVAVRDGAMAGFHWTKVTTEPDGPLGEVYVLGVDPAAGGKGLGRALTVIGLRHLAERGVGASILFVDDDNAGALALYESLGFRRIRHDVSWRRTFVQQS